MTRSPRILQDGSNPLAAAAPPPDLNVAVESDLVVILAGLLCALICVVGLMAVSRCAWLRRTINPSLSPPQRQGSVPNKGLKKKVLQSLPKFTYTSSTSSSPVISDDYYNFHGGAKLASKETECAICLGEFEEGDEIRVLPQCGHAFHVACIDTWLRSHSSCPSCRQILVVATCHRCHRFPAFTSSSAAAEVQLKAREDNQSAIININNNHSIAAFLP